jgi:GTPase SAR1 family protein
VNCKSGNSRQEQFRSISKPYYRNTVGVILVFDLADRKSFDSLMSWLNDTLALSNSNAVIQLTGNKSTSVQGASSMVEADAFARQHQMSSLEAFAKLGRTSGAFVQVVAKMMSK